MSCKKIKEKRNIEKLHKTKINIYLT